MLVRKLFAGGRLDAILAIGGSSGSSVAARTLQALPVGVPKPLVPTMVSGDVAPCVGAVDVPLTYSVVDISGINRLSRAVLGNAAAAAAEARAYLTELGYEVMVFHATSAGPGLEPCPELLATLRTRLHRMDESIDTLIRSRQALHDYIDATEQRVSRDYQECDFTTPESTLT